MRPDRRAGATRVPPSRGTSTPRRPPDTPSGHRLRTRVGVIDDHPAVILGISSIVNAQPDMYVAAAGGTVQEMLADERRLDVVLLDLVLADGTTAAMNVRALRTLAPVLAYTSGDRPALIREAGRAGAVGMVRKSEVPEAIVEAIRSVARGEVVAGAGWAAALDSDDQFVSAQLTGREAEVLALYAGGDTAERVAAALFISRETVLDHIRRIRAKYAAVDRPAQTKVDLYRRAVEDQLVGEPLRDLR